MLIIFLTFRREKNSSRRNRLVRDVNVRKWRDNSVLPSSVVPRRNVAPEWNVNVSWRWNDSDRLMNKDDEMRLRNSVSGTNSENHLTDACKTVHEMS